VGRRRDYTWFLQDGFFVRSPLKVNGVTVAEDERRKYEANYLRRTQRRDQRQQQRDAAQAPPIPDDDALAPAPPPGPDQPLRELTLIRQTREPQFISSAYFLRFKFDRAENVLGRKFEAWSARVLRPNCLPTSRTAHDASPAADEQGSLVTP
jgi:hypothetical protein